LKYTTSTELLGGGCVHDFANEYDSINRVYMARALSADGIPPYLINAALSLNYNPTARVMSNSGLSDAFI
jgi:hypothetical protein